MSKVTITDFKEILSHFPQGIIAGGAVRDYVLGLPPKDIDVFMSVENWLVDPPKELFVSKRTPRQEYEENFGGISNIINYDYKGFDVQLILLLRGESVYEKINAFDIGLCKAFYDGALVLMPEFLKDYEEKTLSVYSGHRGLERAARINEKFGFKIVDRREPAGEAGLVNAQW